MIVAEDPPQELGGGSRLTEITFVAPAGLDLGDIPEVESVEIEHGVARVQTARPTRVLAAICGWAEERGVELERLQVARPSLEDVYLELVQEATAP